MEHLQELDVLYSQIREEIDNKEYKELVLPSAFKSQVTEYGDRNFVYHHYTALAIKKNGDQIVFPNFWFYLAADILPFDEELHKYYDQIAKLNLFSDSRLSQLKTEPLTESEQHDIYSLVESPDDASKICKFLTNYKWWHGGKDLGRVQKDYYVSAILSLSGLVNDSSSYLSSICEVLRERPYLARLLKEHYANSGIAALSLENLSESLYRPYITAIKSKPFLLLAGISGTGKSRIVRELARACWDEASEEYGAQKPRNFEMVQVKPNWHDSSELIGYVSRIGADKDGNGVTFVAGDFLKFVAKAWEEPEMPYFLCLDEMNLAPVEQYFAEYLSVIESRKAGEDGHVTTDPILKSVSEQWYWDLCNTLTDEDHLREQFRDKGISIPQNLIVVGTVNMDETTFSFSRKVLDRAMTIEMNKVDLKGGLYPEAERIGKLRGNQLIGVAVEGKDVYSAHKDVCDKVIAYLQQVNDRLEGTPFKIAYRTRNEALLYVVNNLPYTKDEYGNDLAEEFVVARALDEMTNMKILSRIEGDETKVPESFLKDLGKSIKEGLETIAEGLFDESNGGVYKSASLAKLKEMGIRLRSGYTSFWS